MSDKEGDELNEDGEEGDSSSYAFSFDFDVSSFNPQISQPKARPTILHDGFAFRISSSASKQLQQLRQDTFGALAEKEEEENDEGNFKFDEEDAAADKNAFSFDFGAANEIPAPEYDAGLPVQEFKEEELREKLHDFALATRAATDLREGGDGYVPWTFSTEKKKVLSFFGFRVGPREDGAILYALHGSTYLIFPQRMGDMWLKHVPAPVSDDWKPATQFEEFRLQGLTLREVGVVADTAVGNRVISSTFWRVVNAALEMNPEEKICSHHFMVIMLACGCECIRFVSRLKARVVPEDYVDMDILSAREQAIKVRERMSALEATIRAYESVENLTDAERLEMHTAMEEMRTINDRYDAVFLSLATSTDPEMTGKVSSRVLAQACYPLLSMSGTPGISLYALEMLLAQDEYGLRMRGCLMIGPGLYDAEQDTRYMRRLLRFSREPSRSYELLMENSHKMPHVTLPFWNRLRVLTWLRHKGATFHQKEADGPPCPYLPYLQSIWTDRAVLMVLKILRAKPQSILALLPLDVFQHVLLPWVTKPPYSELPMLGLSSLDISICAEEERRNASNPMLF